MYDTILGPTDGSEPASRALDHALDLAESVDASVHVLYVIDANRPSQGAPGINVGNVREALAERGRETVEAAAERGVERGVRIERAVEEGTPEEAIASYAERHGVDVVVMGTHGRTGVDRVAVGSVTERTVRTAPVPVLAV
jgi:nucleotide-binding universal stress UspA family protein